MTPLFGDTVTRNSRPANRDRRMTPLHRKIAIALLLVVTVGLLAPAPALAHSFLTTTRPAQDERLVSSPSEIALQFSEAVAPETVVIEVTTPDGVPVATGPAQTDADGRVVRLSLVETQEGVLRTSWFVVSAVDGHEAAGEFAFGIGDDVGAEPTRAATAAVVRGVPAVATFATWLFLLGWSLALGAAVLARKVADPELFPGRVATWVRIGCVTSLAGLALRLASVEADGRVAAATVAAGAGLLAALALLRNRQWWPPVVALGIVAVAWPARGHAAASSAAGWLADSIHLASAGVWVGGLAVVLVSLVRPRDQSHQFGTLVRSYANLALVAVATLVVSGVVTGWLLVPSVDSLAATGYGRLVLVKSGVLIVAVAAAVVGRRRLSRRDESGVRPSVIPEFGAVVVAVLIGAVLLDAAPPATGATDLLLGPPPMAGPVARAAALAGPAVTVDMAAGDGRLDVNLRLPSGGVSGNLELRARLPDGTNLELIPRPCGAGCWTLQLDLAVGTTTIDAAVTTDDGLGGAAELALTWPPRPAEPERFTRMLAAMRSVPTVEVVERAAVDPGDGAAGIALDGEEFVALMPWSGGGATDVHPVAGDPERFTFYLPGSHMYFDVTTDDRGRLVRQRFVNPGHEFRYRFTYP